MLAAEVAARNDRGEECVSRRNKLVDALEGAILAMSVEQEP